MTEELRTVLTLVGGGLISYLVARFTVKHQLHEEREARGREEREKEEARMTLTDIEAWLLERMGAKEHVRRPREQLHPGVLVGAEHVTEGLDALDSLVTRTLARLLVKTRGGQDYIDTPVGKRALERYLEKKGIDTVDWRPDEPSATA